MNLFLRENSSCVERRIINDNVVKEKAATQKAGAGYLGAKNDGVDGARSCVSWDGFPRSDAYRHASINDDADNVI